MCTRGFASRSICFQAPPVSTRAGRLLDTWGLTYSGGRQRPWARGKRAHCCGKHCSSGMDDKLPSGSHTCDHPASAAFSPPTLIRKGTPGSHNSHWLHRPAAPWWEDGRNADPRATAGLLGWSPHLTGPLVCAESSRSQR